MLQQQYCMFCHCSESEWCCIFKQDLVRGGARRNYIRENNLRLTHKTYYEIRAINSDKAMYRPVSSF